MTDPCLLIGDIGGTNARFALAGRKAPGFTKERTYQCCEFASADLAINAYLTEVKAARPSVVCLAAAGPIVDGSVRFTNNDWFLSTSELQGAFAGSSVRLLNDFEAIAYSIPLLQATDFFRVGIPAPADLNVADYILGIVGPGTGLGTACLLKRAGQMHAVVGAGGHVGFAPETQMQVDILAQLKDQFERVCDERLISGPGIVNIYHALRKIRDKKIASVTATNVFSLAAEGGDATARETVEIFFEIFGQVAGNLALTLGAFDGIIIGGGIIARKPELIAKSRFRTGFERKGRYRYLMEKIPTQVILHPQPGLLGASYCALQMLKGNV